MCSGMDKSDPYSYHAITHPEKANRWWVYGLVGFCALLLFGSAWFVVARMPKMLSASIIEARRVDITSTATKAPLVFTAPIHREALAKAIEDHDFRFSISDTWKAYRGEVARGDKEVMVLEVITSNRNSPVELVGGDLLLTGKFAFRAGHPADLGPAVLAIAKLKK